MEDVELYLRDYVENYHDYKESWNYEDGCVLTGAIQLYRATRAECWRDFALSYLERRVTPDGSIPSYPADSFNIDSINSGKALFFALDETGDPRYRKAIEFVMNQLRAHPRCACGSFWHKSIYPNQIWLDGLYMAQPFYMEYEMRFGGMAHIGDVVKQFENVRSFMYNKRKGLSYHAYDEARVQPWCDRQTGLSPNFWLRSMGWYLMALTDCADLITDQLYEYYRALTDLLQETVRGILPYRDAETGLFYQLIDRADLPGNYLETSGTAMIAYALLKGVRIRALNRERYAEQGESVYESLVARKLQRVGTRVRLTGACAVAGLGPGDRRDGSADYYLSEPVVADDAKAVGALMMATAEYKRR